MSQYFAIHPKNPQGRLVSQAVAILRAGGLIVYPTDSCYALGCCLGDKAPMDRIRRIRQVGPEHNFTLVCRDLSELARRTDEVIDANGWLPGTDPAEATEGAER